MPQCLDLSGYINYPVLCAKVPQNGTMLSQPISACRKFINNPVSMFSQGPGTGGTQDPSFSVS